MSLGKCPYCENGTVEFEKKKVLGKNTKVYTCSNAKWKSEDEGESWELDTDATCSFRIWGNSLLRYGKRGIGIQEVKKLLQKEEVIVRLYSKQKKSEYFKYIALDEEYGISVIWEIDINKDEI